MRATIFLLLLAACGSDPTPTVDVSVTVQVSHRDTQIIAVVLDGAAVNIDSGGFVLRRTLPYDAPLHVPLEIREQGTVIYSGFLERSGGCSTANVLTEDIRLSFDVTVTPVMTLWGGTTCLLDDGMLVEMTP